MAGVHGCVCARVCVCVLTNTYACAGVSHGVACVCAHTTAAAVVVGAVHSCAREGEPACARAHTHAPHIM